MTGQPNDRTEMRLEGLILRDDHGVFYEVPCTVIERYRVSDERAVELTEQLAGDAAGGESRRNGHDTAPWVVRGGLYAPAGGAPGLLFGGQSPGLDLRARAFYTPSVRGTSWT